VIKTFALLRKRFAGGSRGPVAGAGDRVGTARAGRPGVQPGAVRVESQGGLVDSPLSISVSAPARRVLVVDDYPPLIELTTLVLRAWGHEVRSACEGAVALRLARVFRPDLALIDLVMPGMDGREVARRLRDERAIAPMALVGVTGALLGRRPEPFDALLAKPFAWEELAGLLARLPNAA
jgi:CheY-like chemotaxis protein